MILEENSDATHSLAYDAIKEYEAVIRQGLADSKDFSGHDESSDLNGSLPQRTDTSGQNHMNNYLDSNLVQP